MIDKISEILARKDLLDSQKTVLIAMVISDGPVTMSSAARMVGRDYYANRRNHQRIYKRLLDIDLVSYQWVKGRKTFSLLGQHND
jgi:predicted transcriptional regulator